MCQVCGAAAGELPGARSDEPPEGEQIREALQLEGGRVSAAAARLGMSRATFWRKPQQHGL